jgi:emfourin
MTARSAHNTDRDVRTEIMDISFERSGGVAGMHLTCVIDIQQLPHEESAKVRTMIDSARLLELPKKLAATRAGNDRFHYKITVRTNERHYTVDIDEAAAPPSLRPLLEWLTVKARERR